MAFGQLVIGPPGSGKSTYCHGMQQFLNAIGRKPALVNLDAANEYLPYKADVDVRDFVTLAEVMKEEGLGPNGGILRALEELETDGIVEFMQQIRKLGPKEYFVIDCPGQIELFTSHNSLTDILHRLNKELDVRLVVVNLVDCVYITQPALYISTLMMTLRIMLQFNLPQVNVLSKIDLLKSYGELPFRLEYYTEVQDLTYLYPFLDREGLGKYAALSRAIGELVADFGLIEFQVLAVENKRSMIQLLNHIDKAGGYLFGSTEIGGDSLWVDATRQGGYMGGPVDQHERWIEHKDVYDRKEALEDENEAKGWQEHMSSFEGVHPGDPGHINNHK